MAKKLTPMKREEFIKKILQGERDFSKISITYCDLSGYSKFNEFNEYLKKQNFRRNPIDISDSKLIGLSALNIHLPFVQAKGTDFAQANLKGANFVRANFYGANFTEASLYKADLEGALISIIGATRTDLRNVRNLDKTIGLGHFFPDDTIVTEKEKAIIEKARNEINLYDVREE